MAITTGHIKAIISADNSQYMAKSKETRRDSRKLKEDIERNKPKIDADEKPFTEAIKRARAAAVSLDVKMQQSGNVAAKSFVAANAAMLAGGVAAGAAVGGLPLLFAAMAGAALSSNETVRDSYTDLWGDVHTSAVDAAGGSVDAITNIATQARGQFQALKPAMQESFTTGSKYAEQFADSVGDAARRAVPGLVQAMREGQPVMDGWSRFLEQTGSGVGDLFSELSQGSASAGQNLDSLGSVTNRTLGFLGGLMAKLSNEGVGSFRQFDQTLGTTYDTVLRMADTGLPILGGATTGVLSAVNGLLTVAKPLDGVLGGLGGTILSGVGAYRLLSAATGGVSDRLTGLGTKVSGLGGATDDTAGKTSKWASATEKAGGALTKLGSAMPVIGAGVVALGLAVDAMGQDMEEAIRRGEALGDGLTKGGSAADRSRKQIADLTAENSRLSKEMESLAARGDDQSEWITRLNEKMKANNAELATAKTRHEGNKAALTGAELAQAKYNDALQAAGGKLTPEVLAAGAAWRAELDLQSESTANATNALMGYIERMVAASQAANDRAAAQLALRSSALELESAQKNLNDVTTKYGADSLQAREATVALEAAQMNRINTARNDAAASSLATNEQSKLNAANAAGNAAILNLVATSNGQWSPTLQTMIGTLSATELASIGVTRSVNETGQAVYRLPDGKTITVTAETQAAKDRLAEIEKYRISDKFFTVVMKQQVDVIGTPIAGSNRSANAASGLNSGGWVPGDGPDRDSVPTVLTPKEFVVNRPAAARFGPWLEAINKAAGGDVKMRMPMLAAAPMPTVAVPAQATAQAASASRASFAAAGGDSGTSSGRTIIIKQLVMNQVRSLPTAQELRNALHDVEVQYG